MHHLLLRKGFQSGIVRLFVLLLCASMLPACAVMHPNRMLDAGKEYQYGDVLDTVIRDFYVAPGDKLELFVYPKGGYNLIESQIANVESIPISVNNQSSLIYDVNSAGEINAPIIGWVGLGGMSEKEAEMQLTQLYTTHYIDPFVHIVFINKTATVYRGNAEAKEVVLTRPSMTLLEVIGAAGGIPQSARSAHVKVIRMINGSPTVEQLDLGSMDALQKANAYVQPNDIIYIEPGINTDFFQQIAPIITTLSSIVVIYAYFYNINKP